MTFIFLAVLPTRPHPPCCPLLLTLRGPLYITWQHGFAVKLLHFGPTHNVPSAGAQSSWWPWKPKTTPILPIKLNLWTHHPGRKWQLALRNKCVTSHDIWESLSLWVAVLPVSWSIGVAVPQSPIAAPTQTLPPGQQKQPLGGLEERGKCWVGDSVAPKFLNHRG